MRSHVGWGVIDALGLYLHIPFCLAKCPYCDFVSYTGKGSVFSSYVGAVLREAERYRGRRVATLYVGGGTPTVLGKDLLLSLLSGTFEIVSLLPECEVTVEANPGTVDGSYFHELRGRGVNRLSLGVQSMDDEVLALLGRIHSAQDAIDAVRDARSEGFDNINLDVMFGLPGQSPGQFQHTLQQALVLTPEHLSLYALTLEENTPLAREVAQERMPLPDPDMAADMYEWAQKYLEEQGYIHYEISNWARNPQNVCAHNVRYWQRKPYIGLGAGAHSFVGNLRSRNTNSPEDYIALMKQYMPVVGQAAALSPGPAVVEVEHIERPAAMAEMMFLGLRMMDGVSRSAFRADFGVEIAAAYGDVIQELEESGLLEVDSERIRLSARGRLVGNQVFYRFLPTSSRDPEAT